MFKVNFSCIVRHYPFSPHKKEEEEEEEELGKETIAIESDGEMDQGDTRVWGHMPDVRGIKSRKFPERHVTRTQVSSHEIKGPTDRNVSYRHF